MKKEEVVCNPFDSVFARRKLSLNQPVGPRKQLEKLNLPLDRINILKPIQNFDEKSPFKIKTPPHDECSVASTSKSD